MRQRLCLLLLAALACAAAHASELRLTEEHLRIALESGNVLLDVQASPLVVEEESDDRRALLAAKKKSPPPAKKKSPPAKKPSPPAKKKSPPPVVVSIPSGWGFNSSAGKPGRPSGAGGIGSGGPPSCGGKIGCSSGEGGLDAMLGAPKLVIKPIGVDVFEIISLDKLMSWAMKATLQAFCAFVRTGAEVANSNLPFPPNSPLAQLKDAFQSLPMKEDVGYILFGWPPLALGAPDAPETKGGADTKKKSSFLSFFDGKGIAMAFDPCTDTLLMAFIGFETEDIQTPVCAISFSLDRFGFSNKGVIAADDVFEAEDKTMEFWTPAGKKSLGAANSNLLIEGTMHVKPPAKTNDVLGSLIEMSIDGTGTAMINYDPLNNGATNGGADFSLLVNIAAAPNVVIGGIIPLPISLLTGTASSTLYTSYTSSFILASKTIITGPASIGTIFAQLLFFLPQVVKDTVGSFFPSGGGAPTKQFHIYAGPEGWGLRIEMTDAAGSLGPLGQVYDLLAQVVPGLPKSIDPSFSISGPTSGSGMPVGVTVGFGNKQVKLYFCIRDGDCPGGASCNLGVCYKFACPAGTSLPKNELLCYGNCRDGYREELGHNCVKPCSSGVDTGAFCSGGCNSDEDHWGAFCYPKCRDGYVGDGQFCRKRCPDDFAATTLTCQRNMVVTGKGCCCLTWWACDTCRKKVGVIRVPYPCNCGTRNNGCCSGRCNSGWTDDGCTCRLPPITTSRDWYDRGVGRPDTVAQQMYPNPPNALILTFPQ